MACVAIGGWTVWDDYELVSVVTWGYKVVIIVSGTCLNESSI